MNQSKFSLADVLTALASLAFGFVCFLGANFLNIGNEKVWGMSHITGCVVISVCISALFFSTAYGAKLLKRTSRNFKTCRVWERVLLVLFTLFAVFFATKTTPFPHFFTVEARKSEIIDKLQKSIRKAENMFTEYESYAAKRENLYKHNLQRVATLKNINPPDYTNYGFSGSSGVSDDSQIDTKMFTVHADLFPTNYSDSIAQKGIKEVAANWLHEANSITRRWKRIGIVGVVNDIEKNSNQWLDNLVRLSQVHEFGEEATDFEYAQSFDEVKSNFTIVENPTELAIGFSVLAYVLMLFSWYVTKRNTRAEGAFTTKPYEVIL